MPDVCLLTINLDEIEVRGEHIEAVKRVFRLATPERRDRTLSRLSSELGYVAIHRSYEGTVKSWKRAQQKS